MNQSVIIVGMGEMGGVFARGFLKAGYSVIPVNRNQDMLSVVQENPQVQLILIAVAEKDLPAVLAHIPASCSDRIGLLQNELLPNDWLHAGLKNPTVISVWFEKKPGMDARVLLPSPVHGPAAAFLQKALGAIQIPAQIIDNEDDMLFELVRKNLYILTTNLCGLQTGGNVSQLWKDNAVLLNHVFDDILKIQEYLTGKTFQRDHLLSAVLTAFEADPDHQCMGRSAVQRLQRALHIAQQAGLDTPQLENLAKNTD
jgi:ketopantoate reductase